MKTIFFIICVFVTVKIFTQGQIKGSITYLNSYKKPAEGVYVHAKGSNGDYSKSDGRFTLNFPHYSHGKTIFPKIGNEIVLNGKGISQIELVNIQELEFVNIPIDPNKFHLKIVVCPKGYRDKAALKYYKILKTESDIHLKRKEKELIAIKQKLNSSNSLIKELTADINRLRKINLDTVKYYKEAFQIASINRDFSNKRTLDYLDALDAGIDVNNARKVLSTKKAYQEALTNKDHIYACFDEIYRDANSLVSLNKYKKALHKFDTISLILKDKIFNSSKLIDHLMYVGDFCYDIYYENKAIDYYNQALILAQNNNNRSIEAKILRKLGRTYVLISKFKKAEDSLNESQLIFEDLHSQSPSKYNLSLANTFKEKGLFYNHIFEYKQAENFLSKSLSMYESLNSLQYSEDIADLYILILELSNRLHNNFFDDKIDINIEKRCIETKHKISRLDIKEINKQYRIALINVQLLAFYEHNEKTESAKSIKNELIKFRKKYLKYKNLYKVDKNNLELNNKWLYINARRHEIYDIFNSVTDNSNSINIQNKPSNKSINLLKSLADYKPKRYNIDLSNAYSREAFLLVETQPEKTILYFKKALELLEFLKINNPDYLNNQIAMINTLIAACFEDNNNYDDAQIFFKNALHIYEDLSRESSEYEEFFIEITQNYIDVYLLGEDLQLEIKYNNLLLNNLRFFSKHSPTKYLNKIIDTQINIGDIYEEEGNYLKAKKIYSLALENYEKLDTNSFSSATIAINIWNKLGKIELILKNYNMAKIHLLNAVQKSNYLLDNSKNKLSQSALAYIQSLVLNLWELGIAFQEQENYINSVNSYIHANNINNFLIKKELSNNKKLQKNILKNLVIVYRRLAYKQFRKQNYINSVKSYQQILTIINSQAILKFNNSFIAEINLRLGSMYAKTPTLNKSKSIIHTKKAIEFYKNLKIVNESSIKNMSFARGILTYWNSH